MVFLFIISLLVAVLTRIQQGVLDDLTKMHVKYNYYVKILLKLSYDREGP